MSVLASVNSTGFVLKWAAILGLLIVIYLVGRGHGAEGPRAELAEYKAQVAEDAAEIQRLAAETAWKAAEAQRLQVATFNAIDRAHQQEKEDAEVTESRIADALRTGALRLRQRLAAQEATAALTADVLSASTGAGRAEGGTGLRPEDAGFLVRIADEADAAIRGRNRIIEQYERGSCLVSQ